MYLLYSMLQDLRKPPKDTAQIPVPLFLYAEIARNESGNIR